MQVQALDLQPGSAKFDKSVRKEFLQFKAEAQKMRSHGYACLPLRCCAAVLSHSMSCNADHIAKHRLAWLHSPGMRWRPE